MGARQRADFGHDGTHGDEIAPVDALLGVEHRVAHDMGFESCNRPNSLAAATLPSPSPTIIRRPACSTAAMRSRRTCFSGIWKAAAIEAGDRFQLLERQPVRRFRHRTRLLRGLLGQADDRLDRRCMPRWPNITASSITCSDSSCASDSTISTRRRAGDGEIELGIDHVVDRRIEHIGAVDKPTRAAPIGPMKGRPEMVSAALKPRSCRRCRDRSPDRGSAPGRRPASRCDSRRRTADGSGGRSAARSASRARSARARA
jgi:hypothetical protein